MFAPRSALKVGRAGPARPTPARRDRLVRLVLLCLVLAAAALWVNRTLLMRVWYRLIPLPALVGGLDPNAAPQPSIVAAERYLEAGQGSRAEEVLRTLLERHPDLAEGWMLRARAEFAQQKWGPAYASLQVAMGNLPPTAEAHFLLGQLQERRGDENRAEAEYRAALRLQADHAGARKNLGRLELVHLHYGAALEHFTAALRKTPKDVEVLRALAQAHGALGHAREGEQFARRAVAVSDSADAWFMLGTLLKTDPDPGRREEGAAAFQRALDRNPKLTLAHHELGSLAFQRGDYPAAMRALERTVRELPLHKQSYPLLAQCYQRLDRPADAARTLKEYARLDTMDLDTAPLEYSLWAMPQNTALRLKLAKLYVKYGRPDLASIQVALALETSPSSAEARRLRDQLRAAAP